MSTCAENRDHFLPLACLCLLTYRVLLTQTVPSAVQIGDSSAPTQLLLPSEQNPIINPKLAEAEKQLVHALLDQGADLLTAPFPPKPMSCPDSQASNPKTLEDRKNCVGQREAHFQVTILCWVDNMLPLSSAAMQGGGADPSWLSVWLTSIALPSTLPVSLQADSTIAKL
jgi:hypothetical protein